MKTVYFLIFALIFLQISCGITNTEGDAINYCSREYRMLGDVISMCKVSIEPTEAPYCNSNYRKDGYMNKSETFDQCHDFLDQFYNSCEGAETLTYDFLKNEKGCFNYPFKTKKEACVINKIGECEAIYNNCGIEKMGSMCQNYEFVYSEGGNRKDIKFNSTEIETYCESTINGDEEISSIYDIFNWGFDWNYSIPNNPNCEEPYQFSCDNVPIIDFRNDDWKAVCPSELVSN
ncbi:hypothetical protein JXR93_11305 [bacterium]|nr:hypothetical protein [bacterium]